MATVLRLGRIARGPGALQQHHLGGPLQAQAQAPHPIGGQQQIPRTRLETGQPFLPFRGGHLAGEQGAPEQAMQLLQGGHKAAEHHHRLAPGLQLLHQGQGSGQLLQGRQAPQPGEQG